MVRKPKNITLDKIHRSFIYQCQNELYAEILDDPPGPLANPYKAFTFSGIRHHDGDVEWGIYRWYVNGTFVYGNAEPGWNLLLETCQEAIKGRQVNSINYPPMQGERRKFEQAIAKVSAVPPKEHNRL